MKFRISLALAACLFSTSALANDNVLHLPLSEVIERGLADGALDGSVHFYLEGQSTPAVQSRHGEDITNKRTNAVNKSDPEACEWVALSALIALQQGAKNRGANAVVGITSFFRRNTYSDPVNFECHAGRIMAGVTLKGTYAKVAGN